MTSYAKKLVVLAIAALVFPLHALAMDKGHQGEAIHTALVAGYTMTYYLIDMRDNIKNMGDMPGMETMTGTHHLMVMVKGPNGMVMGGTAGYMVTGPDGKSQKAMCMAMGDGYGADIRMMMPGTYTIKTKVAAGGKNLMDSFTYDLKK
jgi:hypothetical protein